MISLFANVFNGIFITDMPTCYKLMPTALLQSLDLQSNGFGIDAEITAKLARNKISIKEIPIKTFYGNERSSIHIIYAIRFFLKTLKFKLIGKL